MVSVVARTNAQNIRKNRQDDHRARLAEGQHLRHVAENINKIEGLDVEQKTFSNELNKLKVANECRMKLIDKYVPSLKAVEHTGEAGGAIQFEEWLDTLE